MVTGGNVQIVWKKFLRYFDVEPRIVPLKSTEIAARCRLIESG